jgi:hypothetical protein
MPHTQTATHDAEALSAEEPLDVLPWRPRRRLLTPIPIALLGVLLLACGFIGGVLVEKGQTSSAAASTGASGLAARLAAIRGATGGASVSGSPGGGGAGNGATGGAGGGSGGGGSFEGRFGRFGGAAGAGPGSLTIGEVSYVDGHTLYVTNAEGNTVKVTTSPASSITKTVTTDIHGIHPGDTLVVRGAKGSRGAVNAESITINGAGVGVGGGGLGSLFGGGSRSGG